MLDCTTLPQSRQPLQQNLDFYTEIMGHRFVKRAGNFDAPRGLHFYLGDDGGWLGAILMFLTTTSPSKTDGQG